MGMFIRVNGLLWAMVVFTAAFFPARPVRAAHLQECYQCHGAALEAKKNKMYIHSPFGQQECTVCHLESELAPVKKKNSSRAVDERQKIFWFGESSLPDTTHWFLVPAKKMGAVFLAEARGGRGALFRKEIAVPPLAGIPEAEDSGKPPSISGVRVLEVQRGLFLSATIAWETDVITDARVRYGQSDLNQTSVRNSRLGRKHQVVLTDLKPGKTYRYSVLSSDLFRRQSASEPLTFSTAKPFAAPQARVADIRPSGGEVPLGSRFRKAGENYLLELTTDQPVSLFIGAREGAAQGSRTAEKISIAGNLDESHAGLNTKFATTMQVCDKCHRHHSATSHPINVYPKRGMVIPPEYPTLPDGRVTCMSCHETHGSDRSFRLIKAGQRELCVGCHRDML